MTDLDTPSLRTAGDSWHITESVGATALAVAASRAVETAGPDPLIRDEFAAVLVSSAGPAWARLADADMAWLDGDQHGQRIHRIGCDYQAVRTHYFDEFFGSATSDSGAGIRQVVILAAGLDSRAYRLQWPSGTEVYEIDQPKVLEYKADILSSLGAHPVADRHAVAVDLRDDWPAALVEAGFDSALPTAWLAEGLLSYLPSDAQDRLFEMCTALSAPGSQLAVEAFNMKVSGNKQRWNRMRDRLGLDVNIEELTYHEPHRSDPVQWLTDHGWQVRSVENHEEMARRGRPVPQDLVDEAITSTLIRAPPKIQEYANEHTAQPRRHLGHQDQRRYDGGDGGRRPGRRNRPA